MGKVTRMLEYRTRKLKDGRSKRFGPYQVDYWREGGKLKKKYIGNRMDRPEPLSGFVVADTSQDYAAELLLGAVVPDWWCCDLLGIVASDTFSVRRAKYRLLVKEVAPGRGAYNPRLYRILRAAWDQLRKGRR